MFETFSEIKEIAALDRRAVCGSCAYGGLEIEAYRGDSKAFVEVSNGTTARQAELTIDQFKDLSHKCDWAVCGAASADDVRITVAAFTWLEGENNLIWQRRRGKTDGMMPAQPL